MDDGEKVKTAAVLAEIGEEIERLPGSSVKARLCALWLSLVKAYFADQINRWRSVND